MFCRSITLFGLLAFVASFLLAVSATPLPVEGSELAKRICMRSCKLAQVVGHTASLSAAIPKATESQVVTFESVAEVAEQATALPETTPAVIAALQPETVVPSPSSASVPAFVTDAATWPKLAATTNGASSHVPTGALIALVTAASTLFFAL